MKISYNWLREYIDLEMPPVKLSDILTNTGLEVESLEEFESVKGGMEGIVVGEVISCSQHPNADKLSVTRVDTGHGHPLPIVCGAPNVAKGQKVLVATAGTTLFKGDESFTIKKTKIRGEVSDGMICSEDEVGLGDDHTGIVVLNSNAKPGMPASEYFNIEHDTVFEIGLTPNRIDGASHLGVARDIRAALHSEMAIKLTRPDVDSFAADNNDLEIRVEIGDPEACIRYSGVSISGITISESPAWLQNRLRAIGQKPINNVVDITNFVLHETGQPLHAFDAGKIRGKKVIVKTLPDKSHFISLDGETRELSEDDLMICDEEGGMCIAGVFGGIQSGVSHETRDVFLESACFNPVWVRRTSKRHGLSTDSSFRFERGTDPNGTLYALKRAALLIKELAGGTIASGIVDIYPVEVNPYPVRLNWDKLDRLVGVKIPRDTVREILELLDIHIVSEDKPGLNLVVATYRVEVRREADVIEEILRIYGYNTIGIGSSVHSTLSYSKNPDPELLENLISEQLVAQGFLEIMANSLTRSGYYQDNLVFNEDETVKLLNPLSSDLGVMRQSLLYGALEAVALNIKHKYPDLKLFEFGNTYRLNRSKPAMSRDAYQENRSLILVLTGSKSGEHWNLNHRDTDFYQLKAYVENILLRLGYFADDLKQDKTADHVFAEGLSCKVNNKEIALLGSIKEEILETFEIEQPVLYAELNWTILLKHTKQDVRYREIPKYPSVRRDLALVIDRETEFETIRQLAFQVERKLLKRVNLFDVFESDKLGDHKKSYAISFILQDDGGTLTDNRIDKVMSSLLSAFEGKLGARLR